MKDNEQPASLRRVQLTREGAYYLFVVTFVVLGAVLREVNLLVVLAGMMLGPFVFNWRLAAVTIRGWNVRRVVPKRVGAGDAFQVELHGSHSRRRIGSWAVTLRDRIERQDGGAGDSTEVEVLLGEVPPGETTSATYRVKLTRRGRYRFGPVQVQTGWPLGLVQSRTSLNRYDSMIVWPAVGRLTAAWTRLIEADRMGDQRSQRRRGLMEGDYYGLREWRPGDSQRWVHWRTSAKLGRLAVLQFEQQRSREVAILLDLWQPAGADERQRACSELAISFAASAILGICRRGGTRLAMAIAGAETPLLVTPHASPAYSQEVMDALAVARPVPAPALDKAVEQIRSRFPRAAHFVVISTRPEQPGLLVDEADMETPRRALRLWIDLSDEQQLTQYFRWEEMLSAQAGRGGFDAPRSTKGIEQLMESVTDSH